MVDRQPPPVEILDKFPSLGRARNLFIQLFHDSSRLIQLGYNQSQLKQAKRAIALIDEPGEVVLVKNPCLDFIDEDEMFAVLISELNGQTGYHLWAAYNPENAIADPDARLLTAMVLDQDRTFDHEDTLAEFNLIRDETGDSRDLHFLVTHFFPEATYGHVSPEPYRLLTALKRKLGTASPYTAAWVDDETKMEFVIEIDLTSAVGEQFFRWRRVGKFSDEQGEVTAFGRKPTSEFDVRTLLRHKRREDAVIVGKTSWQPTYI